MLSTVISALFTFYCLWSPTHITAIRQDTTSCRFAVYFLADLSRTSPWHHRLVADFLVTSGTSLWLPPNCVMSLGILQYIDMTRLVTSLFSLWDHLHTSRWSRKIFLVTSSKPSRKLTSQDCNKVNCELVLMAHMPKLLIKKKCSERCKHCMPAAVPHRRTESAMAVVPPQSPIDAQSPQWL